jgi:hypothetical protein
VVTINEGPTFREHDLCINKEGKTVFDLSKLIEKEHGGFSCNGEFNAKCCRDTMVSTLNRPERGSPWQFHEGFLGVWVGKKRGYVNKFGEMAIAPKFDGACDFHEGMAAVTNGAVIGGLSGFIDHSGSVVIAQKYKYVQDFSEGLAPVRVDNKWGFVDKSGKMVIKPKFEAAQSFAEGLAQVGLSRAWP